MEIRGHTMVSNGHLTWECNYCGCKCKIKICLAAHHNKSQIMKEFYEDALVVIVE